MSDIKILIDKDDWDKFNDSYIQSAMRTITLPYTEIRIDSSTQQREDRAFEKYEIHSPNPYYAFIDGYKLGDRDRSIVNTIKYSKLMGRFEGTLEGIIAQNIPDDLKKRLQEIIMELRKSDVL